MSTPETFDAIILAGGASSRLGRPKALLNWRGIPLWQHIAKEVASVARKVLIVGFPGEFSVLDLSLATFIDDPLHIGPLGGLAIGLRHAEADKIFVTACDMPFVRRGAILDLISNSKGVDIVVPRTSDGIHPLFAVYSRACLAEVEEALARSERRIRSFYKKLCVRELAISEDNSAWKNVLVNVNTLDDLTEAMGTRDEGLADHLLRNT